jgi:hypothetical protein
MTKKALIETRRASDRRVAADARLVKLKNTSAEPGGLTTGKSAASTNRNVSTNHSLSKSYVFVWRGADSKSA